MSIETEAPTSETHGSVHPAEATSIESLRQRRDDLVKEALSNPNSDASDMLQLLVLSGLSALPQGQGQGGGKLVPDWTEERRRYRRDARDRSARRAAQDENSQGDDEPKPTLADNELRLEKAADLTASAEAAASSGRPMDPRQVYRQIAEIVGLRAPSLQSEQPTADG